MATKYEHVQDKIEKGVYQLASNNKSTRSTVWRVYRKIRQENGSILENVLYCTGCKHIMSFTHKSTTNLRRHKCHLRYLKKLAHVGGESDELDSKDWYNKANSNMKEDESLIDGDFDVEAEHNTEEQSLPDEMEKHPNSRDITAFAALGDDSAAPPLTANDPLNVSTHFPCPIQRSMEDVSCAEESVIYAQTWSLEYRKLTEEQKFYAKRAIDEIFVLGRLRRLTLNTLPPVTE